MGHVFTYVSHLIAILLRLKKDIRSLNLFEDCKIGWAYIYNDMSKIVPISSYDNLGRAVDAIDSRYIATFINYQLVLLLQ